MKLTKKILSLFLACLMVMSTVSVAQAAVVDTVSAQISSKTETVDVSKSNSLLSAVDGFKPNEMFERVSSTLKNIEIKNPFTAIKSLDFDTTKISANLAKQLDEGESGFERLIAAIKVGFNNAKLYVNSFITLTSEVISQAEEAGSSEVEYGVSSTYTATIPGYILATAPSDDLNVYTVTAENVVIPLKTELAVTILKDGQMVHREDENVILDYSMYKVSKDEGTADTVVGNGGHRLFKVPAGFTEGTSADIYATVDDKLHYAGVYEEETVVFNLKVTDTSYSEEEVTELMFKIGKTQPEYVLAEFNEDFTSVNIFANGDSSDGLMMDWNEADENNPFYAHRDTLETVTFTGVYTPLKSIGNNAFNGCEKIKGDLILPSTLVNVGDSGFEGCSGITTISTQDVEMATATTFSLKDSVSLVPEKPPVYEDASLVIGKRAFYGCISAQSVNLGNTVLSIGESAFELCSSVTEVNSGASCTTVGKSAFKDCSSVKQFVLPNVNTIENKGFQNAGVDGVTVVLQALFLNYGMGSNLPINSNVVVGKTVEEVKEYCFSEAPVQSITFESGSSLKLVGRYAFENVGKNAGVKAFIQGLDTSNIEVLGNAAFARNENLVLHQMPLDNMISIGSGAFLDCPSVVIEELYVPSQVETIGNSCFAHTENAYGATIKKIVFEDECETNVEYKAFSNVGLLDVDFGKSRLTLDSDVFTLNHIENVVIPNTLKEISRAFSCPNCDVSNCIRNVRFVKVDGCETVPDVTYSTSVVEATRFTENVVFEWVLPKLNSDKLVDFPAFDVGLADGSPDCTITYDVETIKNASYSIDESIYYDNTKTTNVKYLVFTDRVEIAGDGGNFPLADLKGITFGKNLKKIGPSAFSLGYVNIYINRNNKTYIAPDLSECDIVIPDSVEYIGSEAFWVGGYTGYDSWYGVRYYTETDSTWKSVSLGSGIKEIGNRAFYRLPNATGDLVIGDNCFIIGDSAFEGGSSFKSISLGKNVRKIGKRAFYGCSNATGDIVISDFVGSHIDKDKDGLCDSCSVIYDQHILPEQTISFKVGKNTEKEYSFVPEKTGKYKFSIKSKTPYKGFGTMPSVERTALHFVVRQYSSADYGTIWIPEENPVTIDDSATFELTAGTITKFQIDWVNTDKNNDISFDVVVEYVDEGCQHINLVCLNQKAPLNCQNVGATGSIVCEDCDKVITESQDVLGECVDVNSDDLCDFCGSEFYSSEISLGENIEVNGEKIKFIPNKTAYYTIANLDYLSGSSYYTGVCLYDSNGNVIRKTTSYSSMSEQLIKGETYYIGAISYGVMTVYENNCCDSGHQKIKLREPERTEDCSKSVFGDSVYCEMCETQIEAPEKIAVPHKDKNNDSLCDVCGTETGNIKLGESFVHTAESLDYYSFEFIPSVSAEYILKFGYTRPLYVEVFDESGKQINSGGMQEKTSEIVDSLNCSLEANKKYTIGVCCPYYGDFENSVTLTLSGKSYSEHSLGEYAFYGCSKLTSVKFGERVNKIPERCFFGCSSIHTIEFNDALESIGSYAFYNCSSLDDEINIGDNILSIETCAFKDCSLIPKIEIRGKNCVLGGSVFTGCTAVKELVVGIENITKTVTETLGCATYGNGWKLVVSDGVKVIGDDAFKNVTGLVDVDYGSTLESIGSNAFYRCTGLSKLGLPSTIKSIGNYAYYGCSNIEGVFAIPEACEFIGNWAFGYEYKDGAAKFTKLVVNDKIKSIGEYAFYGCYSMVGELVFSSALENIGRYAFSGPEGQPTAISKVVMDNCNTTIGEGAFRNCLGLTTLDFGEGKKVCKASSFAGCKNLVTLNLGNGITDIPDSMFEGCSSLTNLSLGSTLENIGYRAFYGTNVTGETPLPSTLKTIGREAFAYLTKMTGELVFTDNLVSIGNEAFKGCTGITGVTLSSNAVSTGAYVFQNCTGIVSTIKIPDGATKISDGLFAGCTKIKDVVLNSEITSIGADAFRGCSSLESSIVVPNSCASVGNYAFADCVKLSGVNFGDALVAIGNSSFYRCRSLKTLDFPDSLTTIGDLAFGTPVSGDGYGHYTNGLYVSESERMGLQSIKMSSNIKTIGASAFRGCAKLTTIDIPDTVENVGSSVFSYCYGLKTYNLPNIFYEKSNSCFYECDGITNAVVPEGPTCLADGFFMGCDNVKVAKVSPSVKTIGINAFGGCYALTDLTLNEGLEKVSSQAFMNCTNLRHISFPNTLKTIGDAAFGGFGNHSILSGFTHYDKMHIVSVSFGDSLERIESRAFSPSVVWNCEITFPETLKYIGDYAFTQYDYKGKYYTSYVYASDTNEDGKPDSSAYDEMGVVTNYGYGTNATVNTGANKGIVYNANGEAIVIPNRVTALRFTGNNLEYVGVNAFKGLYRNKAPLILSGNSLVLGTGCFDECSSVASISVSGIETIPNNAFKGCSNAESIALSEGVKSIGEYAFSGCKKLSTTLIIPSSVTEIGNNAFSDCELLPSLVLGENLVTIGEKAFYDCSSLDGCLTIPDSVETIKTMAFYDCTSLDELYLGKGIKTIGDKAFYGFVGNITNMPSEIENMGKNVFGDDLADEDGAVYIGKYLVSFDNIKGLKSYTVKDGTVTICKDAFKGENLEEVIMPDSVEVVSAYAFADMTELTSVQLSQNLQKMQDHAFKGCTALETLVLPATLSEITAYSFEGCTNLKSVDLPETIDKIGEYAFKDCVSYASPVTVYEHWVVDAHAFDGCVSIPEINVLEGHQQIATYAFANCTSAVGKIVVGEYSYYAPYCFYNCDSIKEVEIAANFPIVENSAFGNCDGFDKVALLGTGIANPENGSDMLLNEHIELQKTANTQSYTFVCGYDGTYSFGGVNTSASDDTLKFSVYNETDGCDVTTTAYYYSYYPTHSLGRVSILWGVDFKMEKGKTYSVSVQADFFETSKNSSDFIYWLRYNRRGETYAGLSTTAFAGSNNTKEFVFASETITPVLVNSLNGNNSNSGYKLTLLDTVKCIAESAFSGKKVSGELVIPATCVTIGNSAFENTSMLDGVEILADTNITLGSRAFASSGVCNVMFSENNHGTIGSYAFSGCTNLNNLVLGGVDVIDTYAFNGCTSLENLRFDGGAINSFAFANCSSLKSINLNFRQYNERESGSVAWRSFENCLALEKVTLNNPDYMHVVFDSWFTHNTNPEGNLNIKEVNTNSLKDWLFFEFKGTYNGHHVERGGNYWQGYYITYEGWDYCNPTYLTNNFLIGGALLPEDLVIPDGVKTLYNNSVYSDRTVTSLYVPDSVESIQYYTNGQMAPFVFRVEELTSMDVPFLGRNKTEGGTTVGYFLGDVEPYVDKLTVRGGKVNGLYKVKEVYLGEDVTTINGSWGSALEKIVIAGDKTNFTSASLYQCQNLKEISLFVDEYSFADLDIDSSVERKITVNMLGSVVGKSFFKNSDISTITGLENIVSIEAEAFYNCDYLTTDMIFSEAITRIENDSFYSCNNLTTVKFGSKVEFIGDRAFAECRKISGEFVVPENIKIIGDNAFLNMGNAGTGADSSTCTIVANIPNCTSVGEGAFDKTNLVSLTLPNNPVVICSYAFRGTRISGTLVIPDGSYLGSYAFSEIPTLDEIVIGDIEYNFGNCTHKSAVLVQEGTHRSCIEEGQCDIYQCTYCKHYLYDVDGEFVRLHIFKDTNTSVCITPSCENWDTGDYSAHFEDGIIVGDKTGSVHKDNNNDNSCDVCEKDMSNVLFGTTTISETLTKYADGTFDVLEYEFVAEKSRKYVLSGETSNLSSEIFDEFGNQVYYWTSLKAGKKYTLRIQPYFRYHYDRDQTVSFSVQFGPNEILEESPAFYNTPVQKVSINGEFCLLNESNMEWFGFEPYVKTLVLGEKANFKNSVNPDCKDDGTLDWTSLEKIELSENNPYFNVKTNVLYDKNNTRFVWIPAKLSGDIVIPEGITAVPANSFRSKDITSVKLASTITHIGYSAFCDCLNLAGTIEIPLGVTIIESNAFSGCPKIETLLLHNGITQIENSAFENCVSISNVVDFPDGLVSVGSWAFSGCSNMKGSLFVGPACVVNSYAFDGCSSLSSIDYRSESEYISHYAFRGCSSATGNIILPDTVTRVGVSAFDGCSNITTLKLNTTVRYIEENSFRGMSSLNQNTEIIIPENCFVGKEAFFVESASAQIAKLHIPSNVQEITDRTFCGLNPSVITCASYHQTMKVVDGYLTNKAGKTILLAPYSVDSVYTIPERFTQAGPYAFAYTSKITDLTIPQTFKFVDKGSFMKMINLVSLKFEENSVNWIEDYGFAYNAGVTSTIQLPSSLIYIGNYAFAGCSSLAWIGIPAETEIVGEGAFQDVPNATLDEANPYITIVDGEFVSSDPSSFNPPYIGKNSLTAVKWELSDDGKTLRISGNGEMKDWGGSVLGDEEWIESPFIEHLGTVETVIIEDGVTNVGSFAFFMEEATNGVMGGETVQTTLKRVVLGKDVKTVGDGAFFGNLNIESIEVSEENQYLAFENGVLKSKDEKNLYVVLSDFSGEFVGHENLETIGFGAFALTNVTSVTLPESVKSISTYAFAGCENLTELKMPGVVNFGVAIILACKNLEYLEMNSNIPLVNASDESSEMLAYAFMYSLSKGFALKLVGEGDMPYFDVESAFFGEESPESVPFFMMMSMVAPIKSVEFGDGITSVTGGMFMLMPGEDAMTSDVLQTVKFGKNIASLGDGIFMGRTKIANVEVAEGNDNFVFENGVLYNVDKTVPYILTNTASERLVLPDTVTTIPFAFGCMSNKTTSITLGSNVETVGVMAFYYLPKLERVEVLSNDVVYNMGAFASNSFNMFAEEGSTTENYVVVLNEEYGGNVTFMGMCAHENKEHHDGIDATCTTMGYTSGIYCNDCGYWIKGHDKVVKSHIDIDNDGLCEVCGKFANDIELNTEKSFECEAYYAIEETDPMGCFVWIKYKAPYTGTYSYVVHDEQLDSYGEPDRRTNLMVFKTDDVHSLDIFDESAIYDALVITDDGYLMDGTIEMQAGETYWFGVRFEYSDESGNVLVTLNYDDCVHDNCKTLAEGIKPISCSEPGKHPIILCNTCNRFVRNAETWYLPHADENDDLVCDDCGERFADIRINETLSSVEYTGEPTLYKFVAPVKGTYTITTSNYNIKKDVYDRNHTKLLYEDDYSNTLTCDLEEGETYIVALYYRYGGDYVYTSDFVINIINCPHNNTRVDEPSVEPVDCGTPGYAGVEWCEDCREYIHNGEALHLPHTDENSDGVCDACGGSISDILPGQTKTIDVVSGSVTYLKFIPTETASYTFTSVAGNGDTYGYLYDENKNTITTNDDGGGNSQFKITYTLEAGKTYYWGARFYNSSYSGSFDVTLTKN